MRTRLATIVVNTALALLVPVAMVAALVVTLFLAWNVLLSHGIGWALLSLIFGGPVIFGVAHLAALVISLPLAVLSEGIGRLVEPPRSPVDLPVHESPVRVAAEQEKHVLEKQTQRGRPGSVERQETGVDGVKEKRVSDPEPARMEDGAIDTQLESDLLDVPPVDEHGLRTTGPLHLRHHFRSEKRDR